MSWKNIGTRNRTTSYGIVRTPESSHDVINIGTVLGATGTVIDVKSTLNLEGNDFDKNIGELFVDISNINSHLSRLDGSFALLDKDVSGNDTSNLQSTVTDLCGIVHDLSTNLTNLHNHVDASFVSAVQTLNSSMDINTGDISSNTGNIATNTGDISSNTGNIATNTGNIATNTGNIATNTGNIATNTGNISSNTSNIATNTSNIATNTSAITTNTTDISTLKGTINGHDTSLNSLQIWNKDSSNNISYSDGNVTIGKDVSISGTAIINNTTTIDNVFFVNNNDSENQWNSYGNELVEGQNESNFGNGCSINGRGNIVATGAFKYDNNFINRGLVRVFKYDGSSWNQYGQDIFGRDLSNAYFGYNVCLNNEGNILAVNSPASDAAFDDRIMMVKVFKYDGSSWNQYGQDISGESTTNVHLYGNAIFLNNDGDKLVVGEPAFNSKKGRVRTYQYQDSTSKWVQFGQDLSGVANEKLGSNVCFNSTGTIMAIGNIGHAGIVLKKVYIYKYNETSNIWESYGNTISVRMQPTVSLNDQGNILAIGDTEGIDINGTYRGAVNVFVFDDSINCNSNNRRKFWI